MQELPAPLLTLDKLAVTLAIPEKHKARLYENLIEDRCISFGFQPGQVYYPSPLMGYNRAVCLDRDGETCRIDFDPYRKITTKLTPQMQAAGEFIVDPFAETEMGADRPEYASETIGFLRLEANPSKFAGLDGLLVDLVGRYMFVSGRGRSPWAGVRPTRLDIATDYPIRMADIGHYQLRKRITSQWHRSGELQTVNLGKSGGNQITIYDKVAETIQRNNKHLRKLGELMSEEDLARCVEASSPSPHDHPITRVEARVRELKIVQREKKVKVLNVCQLTELVNPYEGLEFASMKVLENDADWKDQAVALMVMHFGLHETLKKMPKQTAIRYRRRFQEEGVPIIHPKKVFEASYHTALKKDLPSFFTHAA